ncbi:MAG TPA: DUF2723 domain-containing protein [Edaphocola sp.]|nr:DUF2723 domain-containing protein [Edaphocola sp.]
MDFRKVNNLSGWLVFGFALIVYLMTVEPTVSFWDCGEFISCAYKLEVGHSPGAPLFMLLGRFFAIFAPSPQQVALFVNALSAVASAFTILFLYWSITHFAKRLIKTEEEGKYSSASLISIIGAGVVGALAYTFTDTFWFSAVEGEVYATSSFFTALVFWCILKWEESNDVYADRWLILIAYLIGLSIGVHLLSLLAIPTIALVYYFKRYQPTLKGGLLAYFLGGIVLLIVQYGVIQYIPIWASWFELRFVNGMGMPINSGAIFFLILFAVIIAAIIIYAKKKNKYTLHLSMLALAFMTIGYTCYVPTVIRAKAGVSINMTNPDNVMSLIPYLQRTQYGAQPVFSGQYYDTEYDTEEGDPIYLPITKDGTTKYEIVGYNIKVNYHESHLFPRIWSSEQGRGHVSFYQNQLGLAPGESPTAGDNFKFFMSYQLNQMFWRYFMWNYSGRQNDYQGYGPEPQNGNWITGINGVDKALGRGDFNKMPDAYKNNKAHNTLYFLPFILGILGMVYHFKKHKLDAYVVLSLWFFTGIAVQLYINNTPYQPRERDYQYIAAYAYAMWIGIGVFMLKDWLQRVIKNPTGSAAIATVVGILAAPVIIGAQEWDDHDRSQKTLALDHARNMLSTCDSNAILITNGDNETYPLWYVQEVEGFRSDVRIFNTNLLGTDWQNLQMFNKVNNAAAVTTLWTKDFVEGYGNQNVYYINEIPSLKGQAFKADEVMSYIMDSKNAVTMPGRQQPFPILPVRNVIIPVDRQAVLNSGLVNKNDTALSIPENLTMTFKGSYVTRADFSLMNIIAGLAKDGWKRPLYLCNGVPLNGLEQYLKKEGVLSKFVPTNVASTIPGLMPVANLEKNMDLFLKKYTFGKANTNEVYYDQPNRRTFWDYRGEAAYFAMRLAVMGREQDAIKVLDHSMSQISESSYPTDITGMENTSQNVYRAYLMAKDEKKATVVGDKLAKFAEDFSNYFIDLNDAGQSGSISQMIECVQAMSELSNVAASMQKTELSKKYADKLTAINSKLEKGSGIYKDYMRQMQMQQQQQMQQQMQQQQQLSLPQATN